jgi:hypothetical protein
MDTFTLKAVVIAVVILKAIVLTKIVTATVQIVVAAVADVTNNKI